MSDVERTVVGLVAEDPGMADALRAVRAAASDGGGPFGWEDLKDDDAVSAGDWGRLIHEGVVVSDGDGFVLADPGAVDRVLDRRGGATNAGGAGGGAGGTGTGTGTTGESSTGAGYTGENPPETGTGTTGESSTGAGYTGENPPETGTGTTGGSSSGTGRSGGNPTGTGTAGGGHAGSGPVVLDVDYDAVEGNVDPEHLTDSDTSRPLRAYLQPGEQPHYYFENVNKGLRVTHPDWGDKRTPHNVSLGSSGDRYLLVTDRRMLFVAGDPDDGDEVVSLPYGPLVDADDEWGLVSSRLYVTHRDGREISFFQNGNAEYLEGAAEYAQRRIAAADTAPGPTPDPPPESDPLPETHDPAISAADADVGATGAGGGTPDRDHAEGTDTRVYGGGETGDTEVYGAGTGEAGNTEVYGADEAGAETRIYDDDGGADGGEEHAAGTDTRIHEPSGSAEVGDRIGDGGGAGPDTGPGAGPDADPDGAGTSSSCPDCGADLDGYEDVDFCPYCGTRVGD